MKSIKASETKNFLLNLKSEFIGFENGFDEYLKLERDTDLQDESVREIISNHNTVFIKDYFKNINLIEQSFAIVDSIGSEFLRNYLDICPENWVQINYASNHSLLVEFIKKIREQEFFLAIGTGFLQDVGKFIQHKTNIKCICLPTALSTHVYGSNFITNHEIFNFPKNKSSFKSRGIYQTWFDYKFMSEVNKQSPHLIKYGISDVYALKLATQEWLLGPNFKSMESDLVTIVIVERVISLLKDCVLNDCLKSLILAQSLLNIITEIKGSAPASGTEHLYANVMERNFNSKEPHGKLVAKGIIYQMKLSPFGLKKEILDEMNLLGIYPNEINVLDSELSEKVKLEMINLSKKKKRFSYLNLRK